MMQVIKKNLIPALILLTLSMFAFAFALIPLYNVLCKNLGINGKTAKRASGKSTHIDRSRQIRVEFITNLNKQLNWNFYPHIQHVYLHPGENILIYFSAKNNANHTMTVQAIPSVSPGIAANYLKKTECFCFTQQTLNAKQKKELPVLFHLDPNLPKAIHTITLAYTLFDRSQINRAPKTKLGFIT